MSSSVCTKQCSLLDCRENCCCAVLALGHDMEQISSLLAPVVPHCELNLVYSFNQVDAECWTRPNNFMYSAALHCVAMSGTIRISVGWCLSTAVTGYRYAEGMSLWNAREELLAQAFEQSHPERAFAAAMQQIAVRLAQVSSPAQHML